MNRLPAPFARLGVATTLALSVMLAPGSAPVPAAAAGTCPSGPVTIAKLVRVFESGPGGLACYGGRLLTFRAFVAPLCDGCGGTSAATISPIWLDTVLGSSVVLADGPNGSQMVAFVPPGLGRCSPVEKLAACPLRSSYGHWVTLTAHYDGPVARTCRIADHPPGPGYSGADAILTCRQELIILSVRPQSAGAPGSPPDTGTDPSVADPPAAVDDRPATVLWVLVLTTWAWLVARRSRRSGHVRIHDTP